MKQSNININLFTLNLKFSKDVSRKLWDSPNDFNLEILTKIKEIIIYDQIATVNERKVKYYGNLP